MTDDQTLTTLVAIAATRTLVGDIEKAEALADTLPDVAAQVVILDQIADTLVGAGDIERALAFADNISDSGVRGWVLAGIAETVAKRGDVRGAEALVETITDDNPRRAEAVAAIAEARDEEVVDAVVEIVMKDGDIERAEVLARTISESDDQARVNVCFTCVGGGRVDAAVSLAEAITDTYARALVLSAVADAVAGRGDIEQATELADRAERLFHSVSEARDNSEAIAALAVAAALAGNVTYAESLTDTITDDNSHVQSLTTIAKIVGDRGESRSCDRIGRPSRSTCQFHPQRARSLRGT